MRAYLLDEVMQDRVRLVVMRERTDTTADVLTPEGDWDSVDLSQARAENFGIPIPNSALEAVAEALTKHVGDAIPSQAEVKVLREFLDIESSRVNDLLFSLREAFERKTQ
jgi:hypothetical protein